MSRIKSFTIVTLILIGVLLAIVLMNKSELAILVIISFPVLIVCSFTILILGMKKIGTTSLILLAIIFVIFIKNSIPIFN